MGHVAVFGDDFEAFDGFGVADYVVEEDGAVFFDPGDTLGVDEGVGECLVTMVVRNWWMRWWHWP